MNDAMLVSHRHRFVYIKTAKTAGTSVEIYFEPYCLDPTAEFVARHARPASVEDWGIVGYRNPHPNPGETREEKWVAHLRAANAKELLGEEIWRSYLKFCVVRNPFDKVVSSFWFALSPELRSTLADAPFDAVRARFADWLPHARLPLDRPLVAIDGALGVDVVVRYEQLADDLADVCRTIGVPWEPERLGRWKSGYRARPEPYGAYYDDETAAAVAAAFAWEFKTFGYVPTP